MTIVLPKDNRFVTFTDWEGYEKFLDAVGERPIRVTYDRGALEIMSPSLEHEKTKKLLAAFLEEILKKRELDFEAGGNMTFRRQELDRGLEPDECYWIAHCQGISGRDSYNPEKDPPPDLVIEVDITRRSIDRMAIYAVLGVSEVWRSSRRKRLQVFRLEPSGRYVEQTRSPAFPDIPLAEIARHVDLGKKHNTGRALREFSRWLKSLS